jgi:hypothetical protein
MMVTLSRDAQGLLNRYLLQVRSSMRGHASIDVDDVERDVQGHIDAALEGLPEPVDARQSAPGARAPRGAAQMGGVR